METSGSRYQWKRSKEEHGRKYDDLYIYRPVFSREYKLVLGVMVGMALLVMFCRSNIGGGFSRYNAGGIYLCHEVVCVRVCDMF